MSKDEQINERIRKALDAGLNDLAGMSNADVAKFAVGVYAACARVHIEGAQSPEDALDALELFSGLARDMTAALHVRAKTIVEEMRAAAELAGGEVGRIAEMAEIYGRR